VAGDDDLLARARIDEPLLRNIADRRGRRGGQPRQGPLRVPHRLVDGIRLVRVARPAAGADLGRRRDGRNERRREQQDEEQAFHISNGM